MDKNTQDKSSKFFKKEGFYVILFVCLCVIAIAAAFGIRNSQIAKTENKVSDAKSIDSAVKDDSAKLEIEDDGTINNATEAKNNVKDTAKTAQTSKTDTKKAAEPAKTVATAATSTAKFVKPVDGTLSRKYSTETQYCEMLGTWRTRFGLDIKAKTGTEVKAAQEGVVTKVANDNSEHGQYVEVTHANGLITRYSNLDKAVSVKNGDKVKQGQIIGKIGDTCGNYPKEKCGSYLQFEVLKDGKDVDPGNYVSYKVEGTK